MSRELWISPSQVETYIDCPRKWWFKWICKMKELETRATGFGDVLHAVCERWLKAEGTDRVDLYPEGWARGLDPADAALCQVLVAAAVEHGVLVRTPGRKIEQKIQVPFYGAKNAQFVGCIDMIDPQGISDQKSCGSTKYCATPAGLATDPAMLMYAKYWLETLPDWVPSPPTTVHLRHNYFLRDANKPKVFPREVDVAVAEVLRFWDETVLPVVAQMQKLVEAKVPTEQWSRIAGPQKEGVCKKYGGCPFLGICSRTQTVVQYCNHAERVLANSQPTPPQVDNPMGIFDKLPGNKQQAQAAPAASPAPAPAPAPAPEPMPVVTAPAGSIFGKRNPPPAQTPVVETAPAPAPSVPAPSVQAPVRPPWANADCKACSGTGINSKNEACRGCVAISTARGGPGMHVYDLSYSPDGRLQWKTKEGADVAPASGSVQVVAQVAPPPPAPAPAAPEPAKVERKRRSAPKSEMAQPVSAPAPEPAVSPVAPAAPQTGIPRFILMIGCTPVRGSVEGLVVHLDDVVKAQMPAVAEAYQKDNFFEVDSFRRKDALAAQAAEIARESFKDGQIVVHLGKSGDVAALADALRSLASMVVVGCF